MKLTIGKKLLGMFSSAIFCVGMVSIAAYHKTSVMVETADWINHTYIVLGTVEEILALTTDAESGARGYVITGNEHYLEPYDDSIYKIEGKLAQLKTLISDNPTQIQNAENLSELLKKKNTLLKEAVSSRRGQSFDAARSVIITDRGRSVMDDIRKTIREMKNYEHVLLRERDAANRTKANDTKNTLIFSLLLSLFLILIFAWVIAKHISDPLDEISRLADQMATGAIAVKVPHLDRLDEVGTLARSFDKMVKYFESMAKDLAEISKRDLTVKVRVESEVDVIGNSLVNMVSKLRSVVTEIREGASVLGSSSSEILAVVTQVAAGAIETASAINETTATVEQVKQTAQISNQRAKGVSEHSKLAAEISQNGKRAVESTIEGMSQIKNKMELITENIMKLSERSQTIGEIISSVNDLAEQSNLLAVNASIEAARAGEQGRGFMVVAQEVKILADQSKQATAQVRSILSEIQKATSSAVLAAEQGAKAVESGMMQADESGRSILALNEKVLQAAQAALQIANSSDQQVSGVTQVATAMENIRQASNHNVQGTKQVEIAAQNLNKVGLNLRSLVEQFTL